MADLVILATLSFTREVAPQIKTAVKQGINVISIAEEMSFPYEGEPASGSPSFGRRGYGRLY
ncbi:hypothetical protein JCM15765_42530 [Paradesulfitobacterium aromaticivorans]